MKLETAVAKQAGTVHKYKKDISRKITLLLFIITEPECVYTLRVSESLALGKLELA